MNATEQKLEFGLSRVLFMAAAYGTPWIVVLGIVRGFVGYAPWIGGDTVSPMLGFGLSWITGDPRFAFHLPMVTSTQMSALAYLISNPYEWNLKSFNDASLALHMGMALLASAWFGWAAVQLRIPVAAGVVGGLVGATMPTMMLTAVAYTGYAAALPWYPASMLVLAYAIIGNRPLGTVSRSALAVVGFCAANLYSLLPVVVAAVAAIGIGLGRDAVKKLLTEGAALSPTRATMLASVAVLSLASLSVISGVVSVLMTIENKAAVTTSEMLVPIALMMLPSIALGFGLHRIIHLWASIRSVYSLMLFPLLSGWAVGANVWAPAWLFSAAIALRGRGTGNVVGLDYTLGIEFLLKSSLVFPWAILALAALGVGLVSLILGLVSRSSDFRRPAFAIAALICIPYMLHLLLIGKILTIPPGVIAAPLSLRHLVPLAGSVALAMACVAVFGRKGSQVIGGLAVTAVCVASLVIYTQTAAHQAQLSREREKALNERIDEFLKVESKGSVVCSGVESPGRCSILFGFSGSVRSSLSQVRLPPPQLANGRMVLFLECMARGCVPEISELFRHGGPALLIGRVGIDKEIFSRSPALVVCVPELKSYSSPYQVNAYLCRLDT